MFHQSLTIFAAAAILAMSGLDAAAQAQAPTAQAGTSTVLPAPAPPFGGRIGTTVRESTPDFPKQIAAPAGAPNVLIILLDDVGFGHAGTFGGAVSTPTLDRLAQEGLRYNQFHTTALCSPTRAALLTGRNHHSVGTGVIIEMGTGFPGYTGIVPDTTVGLARDFAAERLCDGRVRQMAQHARQRNLARRSVRPLADGQDLGLRVFLRLHEWRDPPILSRALSRHDAGAAAEIAGARLSSHRGFSGRCGWLAEPGQRDEPQQTLAHLFLHRRHPRPASCTGGLSREIQGQV